MRKSEMDIPMKLRIKPTLTILWFAAILMAACIQPIMVTPAAAPAPENETNEVAVILQQALMQQLHANAGDITIVEVEPVEWSDACMGVPAPDELCAQVVTPGYRVVLEANGESYEYHTNLDASQIRLAAAPPPQIGERIIEWYQGTEMCESAQIGAEGVAFGPCGGVMMAGQLVAEIGRPDQAAEFVSTFAPFAAETPAGNIVFFGKGTRQATPAEQRMIAEWARLVRMEAAAGRSGVSWGLAFAWHREGGIAGFCDDLTAYVSGELYAASCKDETPQNLGQRRLEPAELRQIYSWIDTFQPFEIDQTDPAQADAMTVRLVFSGAGDTPATEADKQAILDFAATLYAGFQR
jgi:hypothetical protein